MVISFTDNDHMYSWKKPCQLILAGESENTPSVRRGISLSLSAQLSFTLELPVTPIIKILLDHSSPLSLSLSLSLLHGHVAYIEISRYIGCCPSNSVTLCLCLFLFLSLPLWSTSNPLLFFWVSANADSCHMTWKAETHFRSWFFTLTFAFGINHFHSLSLFFINPISSFPFLPTLVFLERIPTC